MQGCPGVWMQRVAEVGRSSCATPLCGTQNGLTALRPYPVLIRCYSGLSSERILLCHAGSNSHASIVTAAA